MKKSKTPPAILKALKPYYKWIILLVVVFVSNLAVALLTYRSGIGMGDGSTFYSFARNLASGEVFYQDFIHFRTPGSYALFGFFVSILGDAYANFNLALLIESRVLYPIVFIVAFMFLFGRKYFIGAVFAAILLFVLPEYAQLRTVLALLAVAMLARGYIVRINSKKKVSVNKYFVGAGVITGLSFTFGQEAGLMAGALSAIMILAFALRDRTTILRTFKQYLWFGLGFIVGLLPLLLYVIAHGQVFNFLYYTFYYALIRQPQFMDLPFPEFGYSTLVYYLPFFMLFISTLLLGALKSSKQKILLGILVAFATLRLATHLGRTDMGHLLFVVPELLLVSVMAYVCVVKGAAQLVVSRNLIVTLLGLTVVFFAVINEVSSMLLPFGALLVVLYAVGSFKDREIVRLNAVHVASFGLALAFLFLFLIAPQINSKIGGIRAGISGNLGQYQINGSAVDKTTYDTITKVQDVVEKLSPSTIYAYPILPYFYTLAPNHATSFMTYEPQTTVDEQRLSIDQLIATKPEVIVMAPAQATSMGESLWLINEYIMQHYDISEVIVTDQVIWILQPKVEKEESMPLVLSKYFSSQDKVIGVQSPDKDILNGVMFQGGDHSVAVEGNYNTLTVSSSSTGTSQCARVKVKGSMSETQRDICSDDGTVALVLNEPITTVEFSASESSQETLVLNNVILK